jgi:hypothetical protein
LNNEEQQAKERRTGNILFAEIERKTLAILLSRCQFAFAMGPGRDLAYGLGTLGT